MSEVKFTKGPWDGQINVCHIPGSDFQIGWLNTDNPERKAEGQANARLIAAAPELLEAGDTLARAVEVVRATEFRSPIDVQNMRDAAKLMRTAIAKALGNA